ncbi:Enoyl-CoA hydratase [Desulfamplus magnetovallimortis]|uniref:Enoyl-CoA hydratase n=1 Tax=Desulfamplus magnetovallimortis TaxID=1246637 RepID=A0A1W1HA12_9BACT|nr:enoyl-CoA hydratase/isomerase family protein [Desulfamplus magnetovallimortis]SLM29276.1 Enoyl-CoA hydratase [Desulfamplus magnetovallimortis]
MSVIEWKKDGSVAVVSMCNGSNRQNLEFAETMNRIFDEIEADNDIFSLVLTSSDEKNFSQGVDIEWMGGKLAENDLESIKAFMYGMNRVFKRILLMPLPVIAAINGHAFGNGAMLACACDFRFMKKDRGFFCFPEVDINIPFLPGMIAFVRKAIPEYKFNELKLTGKRVTALELAEHHIIEKASDDIDELKSDVMEFARTFTKKRGIFGEHKRRMYKSVVAVMDEEDPEFIDGLKLFVEG